MAKTNMKALAMLAGVVILAHATASEQCDNPADPLQFHYSCVSQDVNLCIPGRRLKVAQPECNGQVDMDEICVPCDPGTYMPVNNFCNECIRKTECGPGQIENPAVKPNTLHDRECIDRPATAVPQLSCPPCESPTRPSCPPCPECHACPECPTTDVPDVGGEWPSSFPDNGTQPQGGTSTAAGATLINELKDGQDFWMFIAIPSLVLNVLLVVGLCYLCRRSKDFQNWCHLPQNDRPYHSVANGQVEMGNRQGGSGDSDTSARECPQGQMNNNVEGGVEEEANRSGRSSISAGACGRGDDTAQTISEKSSLFQSNGAPSGVADVGNSENETAPKRSVKVAGVCHRTPDNHHTTSHSSPPVAPQPRQGDSVQGSTPSTQPLLASMTQQDKTLASGMPTGAYQQNVPASTVSEGTGEGTPPNEATPLLSNGDAELPGKAPYNHPAPSISGQQAAPLPGLGYNVKGDSPSAQPLLASMAQQGNTLPTDVYQQSVAASGVPERAGESTERHALRNTGTNQACAH